MSEFKPQDLFAPSEQYPNGSSGHIIDEVDGVMTLRVFEEGKPVSTEPFKEGESA